MRADNTKAPPPLFEGLDAEEIIAHARTMANQLRADHGFTGDMASDPHRIAEESGIKVSTGNLEGNTVSVVIVGKRSFAIHTALSPSPLLSRTLLSMGIGSILAHYPDLIISPDTRYQKCEIIFPGAKRSISTSTYITNFARELLAPADVIRSMVSKGVSDDAIAQHLGTSIEPVLSQRGRLGI